MRLLRCMCLFYIYLLTVKHGFTLAFTNLTTVRNFIHLLNLVNTHLLAFVLSSRKILVIDIRIIKLIIC